jgi:hypothetical protein
MNKRTHRETENSTYLNYELPHKRVKRSSSKTAKASKMEFQGFSEATSFVKEAANYDSDWSSTGAYTPFSTLSFASRSTRFTQASRRQQKEARKRYNLR